MCLFMLHNSDTVPFDVYDLSYSVQKPERHRDLHEIMFEEY